MVNPNSALVRAVVQSGRLAAFLGLLPCALAVAFAGANAHLGFENATWARVAGRRGSYLTSGGAGKPFDRRRPCSRD